MSLEFCKRCYYIVPTSKAKNPMSAFQIIISVSLVLIVIQSLVITGIITYLVSEATTKTTDIEKVQQSIVPEDDRYLYKTLFDTATGGTAKWEIFKADKGYDIIEITGEITKPLQEAFTKALVEKGLINTTSINDYSFKMQFRPSYQSAESIIGQFFPSFSGESSRRWIVGFQAFGGIEGGKKYVEVPSYLIEAILSTN